MAANIHPRINTLDWPIARRLAHYSRKSACGCRLWISTKTSGGYGQLKVGSQQLKAHRLAWEVRFGPIPKGLWVLHKCDVRHCINPDHLFLGTHRDNMADRDRKNRQARQRGERCGTAKLVAAQVIEIRQRTGTQDEIAAEFNISPSQVRNIINRRSWAHL